MNDGIYLGVGSNLGDREAHLALAVNGLAERVGDVVVASSLYETPPWGNVDQPAFLNQVVHIQYDGGSMALLGLIMALEAEMGRVRAVHWGPRVIDVDILAFGQEVVSSQRLTLPHPHLAQRAFVLVPWAEIAPQFFVPGLNKSVLELLHALPADEVDAVKKL
ncbi:MAG: 2-amino-4-hydroxy-6-hydroxymethyldihydropteridine diphosphokinase [Bacteroidia bacterium]